MKLGKHTLMIDGNYFIYSRLFVMPRRADKQLLESEKDQGQFMRKLCIDFASEVRKMKPFIDEIVLAVDSKSWRKDFYPEAEYKGTRKQDDSVNWEAVYRIYGEFRTLLAKQGVIVQQTSGAEADDVLFARATDLNNRGKNCIVWTGDRDMIQLVDYTQATDGYTLWYYNTKRNLIGFPGFTELLNTQTAIDISNDDLLFNLNNKDSQSDDIKAQINLWIHNNNVNIEEIDAREFIFKKILTGDKSDNINSVVTYTKEMKTGQYRTFSITDKQADKILTQYEKDYGKFQVEQLFIPECKTHMSEVICRVIKYSTVSDILKKLNLNVQLMLLHVRTIPEAILSAIYNDMDKSNLDLNIHILSQMERILEGTDWTNNNGINTNTPDSFDPFSGLNLVNTTKQKELPNVKKIDTGLF
jgi:5'-3' exonuclease